MKENCRSGGIPRFLTILLSAALIAGGVSSLCAAPLPGGTLDPLTIPKYVQPLVIPPQMPAATVQPGTPAADYNIAIRQFQQQILPGGQWNAVTNRTDAFPATTLWSYGPAENALPTNYVAPVPLDPASAFNLPGQGLSFNYPAFTVENQSFAPTTVRWINDLIDHSTGTYLPHLFAIDQTLHWANPAQTGCTTGLPNRTDCETHNPLPYTGPVPMVTHLHGAHVQPHSDGYPEAWWLPANAGTNGIPASYAARGSVFTQADNANAVPGSAFYGYENSQPATTLWYHDHTIGMTRLNVYAGPAGFWLIRGGVNGDANVGNSVGGTAVLPGPAPAVSVTPGVVNDPNFDAAYRNTIREIPVAIQDRSFNADGSLFYPSDRVFFDGFNGPYIGNSQDGLTNYLLGTGPTDPTTGRPLGNSDISGIWNPEAFFNTIVVNGTTWPKFDVADARYRLRLLNGCNSRTLNLALFVVYGPGVDGIMGTADDDLGVPKTPGSLNTTVEVPFYQIGGDQGFLPQVVRTLTGFTTPLPGNGTIPADVAAFAPDKALLLMSAERADVIVDFTGLATGTRIRMINTAPDAPFGGFGDVPADLDTSGQVMDFVVNTGLHTAADNTTTPVENLILPAEANLGAETNIRPLTLNELVSDQVCVNIDSATGAIITLFSRPAGDIAFAADCQAAIPLNAGDTVDFAGPRQAKLGLLIPNGLGDLVPVPKGWADPVTEMPALGSTEIWEFYNTTVDAHPIHMHLVGYQIVNRQDLDPLTLLPVPGTITLPEPNELGFKDTVVAYPGQITRVKAVFDIAGLYVWHCHIVEHEDNEMMRPFTVVAPPDTLGPVGTIAFAGGATVTSSTLATLDLTATDPSGVADMQFSKDGTNFYAWEPYAITRTVTLLPGDGLKTIYVRYRDTLGNVSTIYSASITLSTIAPTGSILINGDAALTGVSLYVTLTLSATDADGVASMQFSKDGIAWYPWEAYSTTRTVTLLPGDGLKTVYVRYRDTLGTISAVYSDTITLDLTPPTGTIVINGGAVATGTAVVSLDLSAADLNGVVEMQFSKNGVNFYGWEPFATTRTVTLLPGDGLKTMYVRYRDVVGNVSAVFSDDISLATAAPTGSILIDGGALTTTTQVVPLTLSATDPNGVVSMRFSKDGVNWYSWEPFATTRTVTLLPGPGVKFIYVQYQNSLGIVSIPYFDDINLL